MICGSFRPFFCEIFFILGIFFPAGTGQEVQKRLPEFLFDRRGGRCQKTFFTLRQIPEKTGYEP